MVVRKVVVWRIMQEPLDGQVYFFIIIISSTTGVIMIIIVSRCRWGVGVLWAVFTICHAILTAVLFLEVTLITFLKLPRVTEIELRQFQVEV